MSLVGPPFLAFALSTTAAHYRRLADTIRVSARTVPIDTGLASATNEFLDPAVKAAPVVG
jgi:hypothetical protein